MRSELNERSVFIDTESSPTNSPLMYNENQLSAHTSATKVEVAELEDDCSATVDVDSSVATALVVSELDVELPHEVKVPTRKRPTTRCLSFIVEP